MIERGLIRMHIFWSVKNGRKLSDDRRRVCLSMPRDLLDEIDEMCGQVSMTRSEYVSGTLRDAMRGRRELADEVRESLARIEHGLDGAEQKLDSLASRVGYCLIHQPLEGGGGHGPARYCQANGRPERD